MNPANYRNTSFSIFHITLKEVWGASQIILSAIKTRSCIVCVPFVGGFLLPPRSLHSWGDFCCWYMHVCDVLTCVMFLWYTVFSVVAKWISLRENAIVFRKGDGEFWNPWLYGGLHTWRSLTSPWCVSLYLAWWTTSVEILDILIFVCILSMWWTTSVEIFDISLIFVCILSMVDLFCRDLWHLDVCLYLACGGPFLWRSLTSPWFLSLYLPCGGPLL